MSSSSDSGSEDWRWDFSTISDSVPSELSDREIPEGYLQQEIKTSCRIQSCKSTPQPLTGPHGPGPVAARRVSFWAWNCKESRDAEGAVPGCSCCRAFPMITTMSIKDSATMIGRLHLSLFVFSLQFIFGCVIREKRVPQHSQTRTSWTRSHGLAPRHAPPFPAFNSRRWRGLTYASVEEADHQCWLVVVSNIVFFRVFPVEYSNMYNLSMNELCILRGNLYICPHNC